MSQNKTVFPGLESEGDYTINPYNSDNNRAYSRQSSPNRANGTVFPDMDFQKNEIPTGKAQRSVPKSNGKPIVGFLYSISRTGLGEFWPLHIGQNIIGNAPECDIVLGEGTVSQRHANLHINRMKKPEKTEATISDLSSTNGTLVNENSVSVARPVECVNGDIITVGENYDLLLVLIDTKAIGLHVSESFYDVRDDSYDDMPANFSYPHNNATRNEQDFPPRFNGPDSQPLSNDNHNSSSTVGLDSDSGFRRGGTEF